MDQRLELAASVEELIALANTLIPSVKRSVSLQAYYRAAANLFQQGLIYKAEGDLERAYVQLYKFSCFVIEQLPKHPEYHLSQHAQAKSQAKQKCSIALAALEELKQILKRRYTEKAEELQRRRDAEIQQLIRQQLEEQQRVEREREEQLRQKRLLEEELSRQKELEEKERLLRLHEEQLQILKEQEEQLRLLKEQEAELLRLRQYQHEYLAAWEQEQQRLLQQASPPASSATPAAATAEPLNGCGPHTPTPPRSAATPPPPLSSSSSSMLVSLLDDSPLPGPAESAAVPPPPPAAAVHDVLLPGLPAPPPPSSISTSPSTSTAAPPPPSYHEAAASHSPPATQALPPSPSTAVARKHAGPASLPPAAPYAPQFVSNGMFFPVPPAQPLMYIPSPMLSIPPMMPPPGGSAVPSHVYAAPFVHHGHKPALPSTEPTTASTTAAAATQPAASPAAPATAVVPSPPRTALDTGADGGFGVDTGKLRNVILYGEMFQEFMELASANTRRNIETCGVLCGTLHHNTLYVTTLVIPKQQGTSDTVYTTHEEELFAFQEASGLITMGWIHTHPMHDCFLSSVDMHTHASYQFLLREAVAVVIAPMCSPNFGVFCLTDTGLKIIGNCPKRGFHPHSRTVYKTCSHVSIQWQSPNYRVVDIRKGFKLPS